MTRTTAPEESERYTLYWTSFGPAYEKFKRLSYTTSLSVAYSRAEKIDTPTTACGVK